MKKLIFLSFCIFLTWQVNGQMSKNDKLTDEAKKIIDADNYIPLNAFASNSFNSPGENEIKNESSFSFVLIEKKKYRIYLFGGTPSCKGELKVMDSFNNTIVPPFSVNENKRHAYADLSVLAKGSLIAFIKHDSKNAGQTYLLGTLAISKEGHPMISPPPPPPQTATKSDTAVFNIVDEMPQFIKGDDTSFMKWFFQNFNYPEKAKKNGVFGKVYAQFVVDKHGKICYVKILRSIDPEIDVAIINTLNKAPIWQKPGVNKGKNVNVIFTLPINLKLQ